ncbi:hypothetical protein JCM8547_005820 [Rhodosporidiobolus lusitaniae]
MSIEPLWHDVDSSLTSLNARGHLEAGRAVFRKEAESNRQTAIKEILMASTSTPKHRFARSEDGYPSSTYGSAFFSRLTSHFFIPSTSPSGFSAPTFPACLEGCDPNEYWHRRRDTISFKQVCGVKAVVRAAGLEEETATKEELEELGEAWMFPGCRRKSERNRRMGWVEMKLSEGRLAELEFFPPTPGDRKGKGKGKGKAVDQDEVADEMDQLTEKEEDAEDVEDDGE